MNRSPLFIESIALLAFFSAGLLLRVSALELEAVEHFDEGIYASALWYDVQFGEPYPARYLFAPPLLSGLMEAASWIPGLNRFAPFVPCVVLGTASMVAFWWLARSWFGKPAGIFTVAVVSMSDFHVLYSRMALTDVACLFWITLAVGLGTKAVSQNSIRTAVAAGVVCGLAWWSKYTGWLPLAILCSGNGLWWVWQGRKTISLLKFIAIMGTICAVAAVTFAPWWWQLQPVGGYETVARTHSGYLTGWSSWTANLARQLYMQFLFDGFAGQLSLGLGMFAAGLLRWFSGRSTWNVQHRALIPKAVESQVGEGLTLPPFRLLLRFAGAAFAIALLSSRIWTPLMLICITLGGLTGMFLWPVLQRAWMRRQHNDRSPTSPGSLPLCSADLNCAPTMDPALGFCTTLTWFVGMLLATPMYTPYSRLFLPLMASIWLAAAAGCAWWLESNLSVARRIVGTGLAPARFSRGQWLVSAMLTAAVLTSFVRVDQNFNLELLSREDIFRSVLFEDRRSIVLAADRIAEACFRDAIGDGKSSPKPMESAGLDTRPGDIDRNYITPSALLAAAEALTVAPAADSASPEERSHARMIIYVYGEPALLYHLSGSGVTAAPVSHLNLQTAGTSPAVPTFVVFGPNAKRTAGFWDELLDR
ncbi:MAG: glycosyltransferase family 39 protein, partial [Planctomycetaceae bacterium]|nr:glycosyltransferase family 39 protein [Planctomycetaceae bacterium]